VRLTVNGESRDFSEDSTVSEILNTLDIRPDAVAVEVNGEIVVRSMHADAALHDGDVVEIVTFVGGG